MIRAALLLLAACGGKEPISSCADDLGGAWRAETGERWMIVDVGRRLEVYPLFDDTKLPGVTLEVGPRAIDLDSEHGDVKRRFGPCTGTAPAHLTSCAGDALELVLADPAPPIRVSPCAFGRPASSHRERWTRD
ncbi:MAG: hypothetical protein JNL83_28605 [Myxococcales bacterium]|nr:hypothetical protein [Myxococcales bacterium]